MRVLLPAEARKKKNAQLEEAEEEEVASSSSSSPPGSPLHHSPQQQQQQQLRSSSASSKANARLKDGHESPKTQTHALVAQKPQEALANSTSVTKKRPRTHALLAQQQQQQQQHTSDDSKPAAKKTMTGGGRRERSNSPSAGLSVAYYDDENKEEEPQQQQQRQRQRQPLENEPPAFENNPPQQQQQLISIRSNNNNNGTAGRAKSDALYDEDDPATVLKPSAKQSSELVSPTDLAFAQQLKRQRGLEIVPCQGDGNCLFRAVSLQVYGDAEQHLEVRERCLDFMARDPEHFAPFVVGECEEEEPQHAAAAAAAAAACTTKNTAFAAYIARKRLPGVHGNNPEIQACSELYNRPVEVFTPETGTKPLNIFQTAYKTADVPIRLSYHDGNHYNAVVDPLVPTAGLGLGLPGLQPGLADQLQVRQAVASSAQLADETDDLQRALQASKQEAWSNQNNINTNNEIYNHHKMLAMTDLDDDDANFQLEQKVLANSLESFRRQEHGRKQRAAPSGNSSSSSGGSSAAAAAAAAASLPVYADPSTAVAARATSTATAAAAASSSAAPAAAAAASPLSQQEQRQPSPPAVASLPPAAASAAASLPAAAAAAAVRSADEYPPTVQELVMNGFELRKVVHAYELIGDSFDDLLAFLMANHSS